MFLYVRLLYKKTKSLLAVFAKLVHIKRSDTTSDVTILRYQLGQQHILFKWRKKSINVN